MKQQTTEKITVPIKEERKLFATHSAIKNRNFNQSLSHIIYRYKFKMDQGPKCKTKITKQVEENNICSIWGKANFFQRGYESTDCQRNS